MKRLEVKQLNLDLVRVANHAISKKISNWHFNYALGKNIEIFKKEVESYDKAVSPELKELEEKVMELAREKYGKMTDEEKAKVSNGFLLGWELISDEDKTRHEELMKGYNEFLDEESEVAPYYFNPEKMEGVELEFEFSEIIRTNFIK